jgi:hypothetical protein
VRHFEKISEYDVEDEAERQLDASENPDLWNVAYDQRTGAIQSDVFVRHLEISGCDSETRRAELTEPSKFSEPHFPVWYPAWERLPGFNGRSCSTSWPRSKPHTWAES